MYSTPGELVAMGEVLELRIGSGPARYDPNAEPAHHHLACTGCGSLLDVKPSGLDDLGLTPTQRHGYVIDDIDITFRGRCPSCADQDLR